MSDEILGPDSFGGDDSESHYAAPALWKELRRTLPERPRQVPLTVQEHHLPLVAEIYEDVVTGLKTFELRRDDREFKVGDVLHFQEWDGSEFTGRSIRVNYLRLKPEA